MNRTVMDIDRFLSEPDEAERRNFRTIAPIYPFTTENLAGYLPRLDLAGKRVLTVSGSGDQVLESAFHGARYIDAFDINRLSRVFTELKKAAVRVLPYEEFLRYFLLGRAENGVLRKEIYGRVSPFLDDDSRDSFDRLYEAYSDDGAALRNSRVFFNRPVVDPNATYYNAYLRSEETYLATRQKLDALEYRWFCSDVTELVQNILPGIRYDGMLLSNIADYADRMYPGPGHLTDFFTKVVMPLKTFLADDGTICAALVFRVDDPPAEHRANDLYRSDRRKKVLDDLGITYEEIRFPGAIRGYDDLLVIVR